MLIKTPSRYVLDYGNMNWVLEDEKVPYKELTRFLKKLFAELTVEAKEMPNKEEDGAEPEEEPAEVSEEEEEEEEEEDEYTKDLRESLLDHEYSLFSINENGDILLLSSSKDPDNDLLFTGNHAAGLMPVLRAAAKKRAEKLSQLFGNL